MQQSHKPAFANPKSSYDHKKFWKYHDMRGHDTKKCRHLYEAWLASTSDGHTEVEPPKPKTTKNGKSWSKSKDKKKKSNEKKEEDSPSADDGDQSHHDEESTSDKEKQKARRKIFTIRATPSPAPSKRQTRRTIYVNQSTKNQGRRSKASHPPTTCLWKSMVRRLGSIVP